MNPRTLLAPLVFGCAGMAHAFSPSPTFSEDIEFEVTEVIATGGMTDITNAILPGQRVTLQLPPFPPDPGFQPAYSHYTGHHQMRGDWVFRWTPDHVTGFGGVGAIVSVTDDHPAWDAVAHSASGAFGRIGDALMQNATVVVDDASRTALSSTALPGGLPLSAFSAGEVALDFFDPFFFERTREDRRTLVFGRVTNMDSNPDRRVFRCEGFQPPMHRPRNHRLGSGQPLLLDATLFDESGAPVGADDVVSRPIIRLVQHRRPLEAQAHFRFVTDLAVADVRFAFDRERWTYRIDDSALEPGDYFVSLSSPDHDEYILEPQCRARITVR